MLLGTTKRITMYLPPVMQQIKMTIAHLWLLFIYL